MATGNILAATQSASLPQNSLRQLKVMGGSYPMSGGRGSIFGSTFYVDSGHTYASDTTKAGLTPAFPFATINYAISRCRPSQGDVILAAPGHAEAISGAAGIALNVIGVQIIGIGIGTLRPTVTLDTGTAADVNVSAANCLIENIIFSANYADIVNCIDVDADDFTIRNCHFTATATDMNFLVCIQDAAATASDRITIEGCTALAIDASNTHFVAFGGTGEGHVVRGNRLIGDWGSMAIGGAGEITYCEITDNLIYNAATTADACVNLAAASTGTVARNLCGGGAAVANGVTATACTQAENYYQITTSDLNGVLDPPNA
jgi:hypothetical protein